MYKDIFIYSVIPPYETRWQQVTYVPQGNQSTERLVMFSDKKFRKTKIAPTKKLQWEQTV